MNSALIPKKIRLDLDETSILQTCKHYVQRKKRFCKMIVANGKSYCGEHEPVIEFENIDKHKDCRMTCPLDSKHTVYKKNLQKHLKICNSRPKNDLPPYIKKGVNDGSFDEKDDSTMTNLEKPNFEAIKLSNISEEELVTLINKIEKIYKDFLHEKIEVQIFKHDILSNELEQPHYGKETIKHLSQTASILGYLEKFDFLKNETSYVEFGAGKGQVSYWLTKLIQERSNYLDKANVILIDRASLRHKKDNKLEDRSAVLRIRADICDFVLEGVESLRLMKNIVAIGKHLCGAATDLMLRCLLNHKSNQNIHFIVSLCCHHRCTWKTFVGKEFLKSNEISYKEFDLMTRMVSWAVCGTGMSREKRKEVELYQETREKMQKHKLNLKTSKERKEEIGLMCKRVLDYARLKHLESFGYKCDLKFYVDKEVTLENVCIVGSKKVSN